MFTQHKPQTSEPPAKSLPPTNNNGGAEKSRLDTRQDIARASAQTTELRPAVQTRKQANGCPKCTQTNKQTEK